MTAQCQHTNRGGGNDYMQCLDCGYEWDWRKERVPYVPVPLVHAEAAERFRRTFAHVPMSDAEKLPDPDFGL